MLSHDAYKQVAFQLISSIAVVGLDPVCTGKPRVRTSRGAWARGVGPAERLC